MRREKFCKKTAVLLTACLLAGSAAAADSGASVFAAENETVWEAQPAESSGEEGTEPDVSEDVDDFEFYGDFSYVPQKDGTAEIRSYMGEEETVIVPETIEGKNVTTIQSMAFGFRDTVKTVKLPDSVTKIGDSAFYECSSLTKITFPKGITVIENDTFEGCSSLTEITLPDGLTKIGDSAFYGCASLTEITLPAKLTSIGERAFYGCSKLKNLKLQEGLAKIGPYAFEGCSSLTGVAVPKGTAVAEGAFDECSSLENVVISEKASLEGEAFWRCDKLSSVKIRSDAAIKTRAFQNLAGIREVALAERVKIGERAFYNCTGITGITIPDGAAVGAGAFERCTGLTRVSFAGNVTELGESAFSECENLVSVSLPKGLEKIADYAFQACSGLSELVIPEGVAEIGESAFDSCSKLAAVTIPDSAARIGDYAFWGCGSLTSAVIPESVKSIGISVFSGCPNLTITGRIGSAAHSYAVDYVIPFTDPLHTHSYVQTYVFGPYCDAEGERQWTCSVCGAGKIETIQAIGHNYQPVTIKATAYSNGSTYLQCSVCGDIKDRVEVLCPNTVELSRTTFVYDGKAKIPSVTVKDSAGAVVDAGSYTVTCSANKNVGQASVTVTFLGNYGGSITKTFTIVPKGTSLSKLTAGKKGFSAKWKKQSSQTSGYEIQYSTSGKFTKKTTGTTTVKKSGATSAKVKKLKAKKKYYVRIRTFKTVKIGGKTEKLYSDWSKTKSVKTK